MDKIEKVTKLKEAIKLLGEVLSELQDDDNLNVKDILEGDAALRQKLSKKQ